MLPFVNLLTVTVLVYVNQSFGQTFDSQYLGNYLSDVDYVKRDVCSTKVCMQDNDRLIYSATHDSKAHPCDDFREFAMGEFIKHRKLNDRYQFLGFDSYVDRLHRERQKKLLTQSVGKSDPKYLVALKTFFTKCINPGYVDGAGVTDILSRLTEIVGSKVFSKPDWNEQNFKLSSLFNREFHHTMLLISSDEFNPHVYSSVLFDENPYWKPDSDWQKDFNDILKKIKIPGIESEEAIADFRKFLETKDEIIASTGFAGDKVLIEHYPKEKETYTAAVLNNSSPVSPGLEAVTVESLSKILPSFSSLDIEKLAVNLEIENRKFELPKFTLRLLEHLSQSDKRILANNFALSYLYVHRKSFITHSWTRQEANESGTTRSQQRFEQCIDILESTMRPAMQAMFARKFYDKGTQGEVEQYVLDAISDVDNATAMGIRKNKQTNYPAYFKSLEPMVMFHKDILDISFVEKLYEKLELTGSQSLFSMLEEVKDFHEQMKETEWFKDFEKCCSKDKIRHCSDSKGHRLYVPVKFTLYPFFHSNRPRFFNMATIYDEVVFQLSTEIYNKWKSSSFFFPTGVAHSDIYDVTLLTVNRYQSWLSAGNMDLNLSAFKLTSLQMYWLSLAHRNTLKFHKNVPGKFLKQERLESEYLHFRFKNRKSFREAFNCSEMTENETLKLKEFTGKQDKHITHVRCEIGPSGNTICVA